VRSAGSLRASSWSKPEGGAVKSRADGVEPLNFLVDQPDLHLALHVEARIRLVQTAPPTHRARALSEITSSTRGNSARYRRRSESCAGRISVASV
jgi:hypothetical protein